MKTGLFGTNTTYLGDGVYAEFDGFSVWIFTERSDQDCEDRTHFICLESQVFEALKLYHKQQVSQGESNANRDG